MPKLTKRVVDALQPDPNGRELFLWDTDLRGFAVRVMPSGAASYLVQYRNAEGRTRRLAVARVGTLTPDEARNHAREKLAAVAKGADPSADRRKLRGSITVTDLCRAYQQASSGHMKDSTIAMDKSRIERHVIPLIGRIRVAALTRADIAKLQSDIAAGKSAARKPATDENAKRGRGGVVTGGAGVAARTIGMVGTILEFAKAQGVVSENVARGVRKFAEKRRNRFLSTSEISRLGKALESASTESDVARDAVRALLLTGCRRMEILSLKRVEADVEGHCLRLADTKSGPQIRPIGATAITLFKRRLKSNTEKFVFPATTGDGHFVGLPRVIDRLYSTAEIEGASIHTLRHTFAAVAAELGFSQLVIAGLLGHSVPGVTARYAHIPDRALLLAADQVAARIGGLLEQRIPEDDVVPLRRAGAKR